MTLLTERGYIVFKSTLSDEMRRRLVKDLTVCPQTFATRQYVKGTDRFKVYRESDVRFRLPRFYGASVFGNPTRVNVSDGISIECAFNGTLKTSLGQDVACDTMLRHLRSVGGGVLSLPTGYGKTTCALYILASLSVKTLIIVHKEFLLNQWKERIAHFLPGCKVGCIRQNRVDVDGKDVVIGMLQSLSVKEYDKGIFKQFGLTIIDETHHICSRTFSQAMFLAGSKYMLGLSATPERKDGLTCVLNWFVGEVAYSVKRENNASVTVARLDYDCELYAQPPPVSSTGTVSIPGIVTMLCEDADRNKMIVDAIISSLQKGRKVMVLTDRREHCKYLCNCVSGNTRHSCGLYMGGMKQKELTENEACDAIFATYSLAHEGLDIPSLNTLVMATPKTDVVQSVGRILRESGEKTHRPLVIDVCDRLGCLQNQYRRRARFYKDAGFSISHLKVDDL